MKIVSALFLIALVSFSTLFAAPVGSGVIEIPEVPTTLEAFLALRDRLAVTPQGGAAVFVVATIIRTRDAELGKKCLTISLDQSRLVRGTRPWYKGFAPSRDLMYHFGRLKSMPFLPGIYIQGTSPQTGYALTPGGLQIRWNGWKYNRASKGRKIFLHTTSGNLPRPLMMVKNNRGKWKVNELSSYFVGPSRMPAVKQPDDDL